VAKLDTYADDIQEQMRKAGYPDYKPTDFFTLNLDSAQSAPVPVKARKLLFSNMDKTRGFIVEENALSFQTTAYETFEAFTKEFIKGLKVVHGCVTLAYSERIGLRYLDAVVPPNGEEGLADYLAPGVLGLNARLPDTVEVAHSLAETRILAGECNIMTRTLIRAGKLGFPMDLQPMGVNLAKRFDEIESVHAILDTDASFTRRAPFDIKTITSDLKALRGNIDIAFKATVTEHALLAWNS
jgi:uncharacterized protein (TIGR04255 family)